MRERLRGYADAVLEASANDVATIAEQLQSFADLMAGSHDLDWALTSPVTPMPAKRAILEQLLADKVTTPVLDQLMYALENARGDDFGEDATGLAVAACARRDGLVLLDEGPLGRLGATERIQGYADAVLAPVRGGQALDDIEDELFRFVRTVEGSGDLRVVLTTGEFTSEVRSRVVHDLLDQRARPESARLASYVTRVGRPRDFPLLMNTLVDMVAKETNRRTADVRSAVELTAAQRASLVAALTKFTGYPVDVRVTPEPSLLGGFVATIGDIVIDTSLRRRVNQARELLSSAPAITPRADSGPRSEAGPEDREPGQVNGGTGHQGQ